MQGKAAAFSVRDGFLLSASLWTAGTKRAKGAMKAAVPVEIMDQTNWKYEA
jgi:hypothetical protein